MGKPKAKSSSKSVSKSRETRIDQQVNRQKEKSRLLSKIYRQYSRRKYTKYKLQFPNLRESQIVNKIIKEWEALSLDDKLKLEKQFIQTTGTDFLAGDSKSKSKSDSKSKSKSGSGSAVRQGEPKKEEENQAQNEADGKPKKKKKPSPKVRIFVQKATNRDKNFMEDSDINNEGFQKKQESENQSVQIVIKGKKKAKTKMIKKTKQQLKRKQGQSEYYQFYKYYYNKLQAEHPRWTGPQLKSIVKLLWTKRNSNKKIRVRTHGLNLKLKPVSGRVMYRRQKQLAGLTLAQIKKLWRMLPHQSKKFYQKKGRGNVPKYNKADQVRNLKRVLRSGSDGSSERNSLKWMDKTIKHA